MSKIRSPIQPRDKYTHQWILVTDLYNKYSCFLFTYGICPNCKKENIPLYTDEDTKQQTYSIGCCHDCHTLFSLDIGEHYNFETGELNGNNLK